MTTTCVFSLPTKSYLTIPIPSTSPIASTHQQRVWDAVDLMNCNCNTMRSVCIRLETNGATIVQLSKFTWKVLLNTVREDYDRIILPFKSNGTKSEVKIVTGGWYSDAIGASFDYNSIARTVGLVW